MTRRLLVAAALFFVLVAAKPVEHCEKGHAIVYAEGDVTFANGISAEELSALQKRYGHHFAYMERESDGYVTTDPDTLDRIAAVYRRKQETVRRTAEKQIAVIFDQAIRTGVAKKR
jgi:hypothetical protein